MFHKFPVKWKITVFSFGIIVFSVLIGEIMDIGNLLRVYHNELGERLLATARTVSQVPTIINQLSRPQSDYGINQTVERIRVMNGVDYIVVMNMHRKILTDPVSLRIGRISKTADENQAFAEHTYLSAARGVMGVAMRAFVPIMNNDNDSQIGVVVVGKVLPTGWEVVQSNWKQIFFTFLLSSFFGVLGSFFLARHIKRQMLNMEPYEIAGLLRERTATFYAMHEGIIAIDRQNRVTIFNDKLAKILGIPNNILVGTPIEKAGLDERIVRILKSSQDLYNQELQLDTATILYSRVSIRVDNEMAGVILISQDRTEVAKLAEELTGIQEFVDALRVQNHEFLNKLHTIGGLLQLNQRAKALEYISEVTEQRQELTRFLGSHIHDEEVAGLLLAKINRGRELGVDIMLDRNSRMSRFPKSLDRHDMAAIIGNLIENSFEALAGREHKQIFVKFEEENQHLSVLVEDNGCGMDKEEQEKMFLKGFTTKAGVVRGYGMYLVKSIVEKVPGEIHVESMRGKGTKVTVIFPI